MAQGKTITSMMEEKRVFQPPEELSKTAYIGSMDEYRSIYKRSIDDHDNFWAEMAEQLDWYKKWDKVCECDFDKAEFKYFLGGKINVSYNCLDRHLKTWRKNKAAIIFEGEPGDTTTYTYQQLYIEVCKFANVLKKIGVKKGDRVTIYLPMVPELPIAMLACARIGAIHSVVFGGFSAEALRDRIQDSECELVITSDGGRRSGKAIPTKNNADAAVAECPTVKNMIVVKRVGNEVNMKEGRDHWWH